MRQPALIEYERRSANEMNINADSVSGAKYNNYKNEYRISCYTVTSMGQPHVDAYEDREHMVLVRFGFG